MSTIIQITDHVQQMKDLLLEQFKNSRVIQNVDNTTLDFILQSYGIQIQELEDELILLCTQRYLVNAEGVQLDGIGSIVGEPRSGRTDDEYRIAIRVKTLLNRSNGTVEQIVEIMDLASGELPTTGHYVDITEEYPACIIASTLEAVTTEPRIMKATLGKARLGGVCDFYVFHTALDFTTFAFSDTLGAAEESAILDGYASTANANFSLDGDEGIVQDVAACTSRGDVEFFTPFIEFSGVTSVFFAYTTNGAAGNFCYQSVTNYPAPDGAVFAVSTNPPGVLEVASTKGTLAYSSPDKVVYGCYDTIPEISKADPAIAIASGDAWSIVAQSPFATGSVSLVCNQSNGDLYMGNTDLFAVSTDSGLTWVTVNMPNTITEPVYVAWLSGTNKIFVAHGPELYMGSGASPTIVPTLIYTDPEARNINAIFADEVDLCIVGDANLIAFSSDSGATFSSRLTLADPSQVSLDPVDFIDVSWARNYRYQPHVQITGIRETNKLNEINAGWDARGVGWTGTISSGPPNDPVFVSHESANGRFHRWSEGVRDRVTVAGGYMKGVL